MVELAREMRKTPTRSEQIFWGAVRNRRVAGVKFRRQQVIERFVVDFFAPEQRLVVEIDGGVHRAQQEHDALRERFLNDCGLRVLRFSADDVERKMPDVLETLLETLNSLIPAPSPASGTSSPPLLRQAEKGAAGLINTVASPSPFTGEGERGGEDR